MTLRRIAISLAALALAACGSGAEDSVEEGGADDDVAVVADAPEGGMSNAEIAAQMKNVVRPRPGQYSSSAKLVKLEVPGVPEAQVAQLRSMMEGAMAQQGSYCLTQEEADRGFEEMAANSQEGCKIDSFDADGGAFSGRMTCENEGANGTVTMKGTGTPTGSDMVMDMDMSSPGLPGGRMAMTLQVTSRRTGDCEG